MWGTIVNALAILAGGALGLLLRGGISGRFEETMKHALGLSVCIIGIQMGIKTENALIVILSLVLGGLIGTALKLEERLDAFGDKLQARFRGQGRFAEGFVGATLLYCVGTMAVVGSIRGGLEAKFDILYAKSALDGITAVVLASSMGVGVLLSAVPVLLYQGSITLLAQAAQSFFADAALIEVTAVGGVMILAIGLKMLDIKKIRVGNYLPAIFLPAVYYALSAFFHRA